MTDYNKITGKIITCAIEVHKELGPGLLESVYETCLLEELKSVEILLPVHEVQLVTYLKLADKKIGLLINFNVPVLKEGIRRKINGYIDVTAQ